MSNIIIVGIGGFTGAILRYLISGYIQNLAQKAAFPYGTLAVNITGCFLIGLFSQLVESQAGISSELRTFLIIGLLGAYTTYSAFSNETMNLLQNHQFFLALINVGTHLFLGLSAVLLGRFTIIALWR
ncbi:fluoride efflux transporter FluC [Desulfobacterium sp. N47]|uniref:Fluoride-specific ion channel FluC n=1 Tax=uncultured Desulfobacterium sp. TaxID=201089 RepID=E1YGZ6_9BACT|nr:Protein crcB homolog [uncultured Desulfobacterium sp.]